MTNPYLLCLIRPRTFDELRSRFKPVETRDWRDVLADAPERTIEMAERLVAEYRPTRAAKRAPAHEQMRLI